MVLLLSIYQGFIGVIRGIGKGVERKKLLKSIAG